VISVAGEGACAPRIVERTPRRRGRGRVSGSFHSYPNTRKPRVLGAPDSASLPFGFAQGRSDFGQDDRFDADSVKTTVSEEFRGSQPRKSLLFEIIYASISRLFTVFYGYLRDGSACRGSD
jgi:hypothetical protein